MPASDYDLFREYEDFEAPQGHFGDYLEIYRESGSSQLDEESDRDTFFQFLNAFVPDVEPHDKEFWNDIRDSYYDLTGITAEDIDWEAWREANGYGHNT